jgi:hypothetical protein
MYTTQTERIDMRTQYPDTTVTPADRVIGIRCLLEEAHGVLPPEVLAELLLAVRQQLGRTDAAPPAPDQIALARDGLSQAARVYFRPVELLLGAGPRFDDGLTGSLHAFVEDSAARPRGAAVRPAA